MNDTTQPYVTAAVAIDKVKKANKVDVRYVSTHGVDGPGFYAHWLRGDGSLGSDIGRVCATEAEAWLSVAIHLVEYRPGALQMTSREFGSTWTSNVQCLDGSLGSLERRSRFEIRWVDGQYEAYLVDRRYLGNDTPRDVRQYIQGDPFTTLAEAAGFVGQYIADFEGAVADDRDAAVEAQRERDR